MLSTLRGKYATSKLARAGRLCYALLGVCGRPQRASLEVGTGWEFTAKCT